MILALLLAAQVDGVLPPPGHDDIILMHDAKGRMIGMRDRRNGHVIGKWDQAGNFVVEKPRCAFTYTEQLETRALMLLERQVGAQAALMYDMRKPAVELHAKYAELDFLGILPGPHGETLLDPPTLVIDVGVCNSKIQSSELVNDY